jgi:excisionase family DNA binding protein
MSNLTSRPLKVREVADALGLSVHTIRAWIAGRKLAHVRLGRAVRVLPAEIERLLLSSAVPAREDLNREESSPYSSADPIRNQESSR